MRRGPCSVSQKNADERPKQYAQRDRIGQPPREAQSPVPTRFKPMLRHATYSPIKGAARQSTEWRQCLPWGNVWLPPAQFLFFGGNRSRNVKSVTFFVT